MATVRTETIYCFHQEFKRVIRYQSRYSKFIITLPECMPDKEVEGDTETDVIKVFDTAVKLYEGSITETTKVILYNYEVDAYIWGSQTVHFNSQDCDYGKTFSDGGITLSLWATVCEKSEVVIKGGKNYVTHKKVDNQIPESIQPDQDYFYSHETFQEIPWTQENEQFFVDTGLAFEQLVLKLNSVFDTTKAVTAFVESRQKLLGD